jgi:hypothetical protein
MVRRTGQRKQNRHANARAARDRMAIFPASVRFAPPEPDNNTRQPVASALRWLLAGGQSAKAKG